jgi:multidrug efflux pump subunit AcrA (membrane-fusion protein)
MKKKLLITVGVALLLLAATWYFARTKTSATTTLSVPVRQGLFEVAVVTTGELEAKQSENIYGPENLRSIQIWSEIKINELIPEGTVVDSGDFVASLDQTEVVSKLKDLENELDKLESQYTKTMLDTSLNMRSARNELVNLKFAMEEAQIAVDQSQFEPPATQRQAVISRDKAERTYDQAVENYVLKQEKAQAEMQEVAATLDQAKRKKNRMVEILGTFTVYAPKPGMVIYQRDWRGKKTQTGSSISPWDNTVAVLPDLSKMISKTYVNEIDISKVQKGQPVRITIDAFPERQYTGIVDEVANIGQQMQGSDAKVFEVIINVDQSDTIMRPSMTTKNEIITAAFTDVLALPIDAVHSNDTLTFVFIDRGTSVVRKEIKTGASNENEIIVTQGLEANEEVLLSIPENPDDTKLITL